MRFKGSILMAGFIILLACRTAMAAQSPVSAQALVDRATALVGDRIRLTIEIDYRDGIDVAAPEFKDGKIGEFEIKDSGVQTKKGFFGAIVMNRWYSISAYTLGKKEIPPIEIKYRKRGAKDWDSSKTAPLKVTIESVIPKGKAPADIKDIKGPIGYFEINYLLVGIGLLVVAAITGFLLYKFRKVPPPVRLPHETALEELEAARANFLRNSDVKEYYALISDCVRRYIERSFNIKAPEMTTEEFLAGLGESRVLSLDQKSLLKDFLNVCDLVKFAKYTPAKGEMDAIFQAARKFIEETKGMSNVRA